MGQVFGHLQNAFKTQGSIFDLQQVRLVTDHIFEQITHNTGKESLAVEEFYPAILLAFNDINKRLPGPHCDPPTKEEVEAFDKDMNGKLDRDEFAEFVAKYTANMATKISKSMTITAIAAPTVIALATKKSLERVPGAKEVVSVVPETISVSVMTSLVTLLIQGLCVKKG
eukprot:Gb_12943 [translate_table: standard]